MTPKTSITRRSALAATVGVPLALRSLGAVEA